MAIVLLLITLIYVLLIGSLIIGFNKIKIFNPEHRPSQISFSVIIPFRNEGEHLPTLLNSISKLEYAPTHHEIIFVDDDSNDDSVSVIEQFRMNHPEIRMEVLANERNSKSAKKDAILTAIKTARHEWIITTDADCSVSPYWLSVFNDFIHRNQSEMIIGPVTYITDRSFLSKFQLLDFLGLQSTTIGAFGLGIPYLCNGANLAYSKQLFSKLDGFEGNLDIASGDDMFLLHKAIRLHPEAVRVLKSKMAMVRTVPPKHWNALIQQRVRWASKTPALKNYTWSLITLIIIFMNIGIIIALFSVVIAYISLKLFAILLGSKIIVDFCLIYKSAALFNQKKQLASYIFSSLLYPFFVILIAALSLFPRYSWKERGYSR